MRTGLGKQFDDQLFDLVPPILEPAGFKTARSKRAWRRRDEACDQIIVVEVDGRSASEGFLETWVSTGITFSWERPNEGGPLLAGRGYVHQFDRLAPRGTVYEKNNWRYEGHEGVLRSLAEFIARVVLPTLEEFRDPRAARDHHLQQGHLWDAIQLSAALGDAALARELVPAFASGVARFITYQNVTGPLSTATQALDLAAEHGATLPPGVEAKLRSHATER